MASVQISRSGKITFPKEAMQKLGITAGDFLDFEISETGVLFKPATIPPQEALEAFGRELAKMRSQVKPDAPELINQEIEEAIQAARKKKRS
jgi:bifunctional DNA-binding transcriptional regulator/antitoxin component of YhaV-PrlF toxin-antitoxin module